jgi:hypothetical protein
MAAHFRDGSPTDLADFIDRYVSLHSLALKHKVHIARMKETLQNAGLEPAFDLGDTCARLRKRALKTTSFRLRNWSSIAQSMNPRLHAAAPRRGARGNRFAHSKSKTVTLPFNPPNRSMSQCGKQRESVD